MSKEEFERLSDFELHRKLLQCGLPNLPVTETTRNILIKKLVNHVHNERNQRKQQQHEQQHQQRRSITSSVAKQSSSPLATARDNHSNENYRRPPLATDRASYTYGGGVASYNGNGSPLNHHTTAAATPYAGGSSQSRLSGGGTIYHSPMYSKAGASQERSNAYMAHNSSPNNHLVQRTIINNLLTPSAAAQTPSSPMQRSPKIYAPPPILSSESDEEADYMNYSNISSGAAVVSSAAAKLDAARRATTAGALSGEQQNPHFSVVSRLLNLRGKTLGIQQQQQQQQVPSLKPPSTRSFAHNKYESEHNYRHAGKMSSAAHRGGGGAEPDDVSVWQLIARFVHRRPKQTFIPYALLSALVAFLLVLAFTYIIISPDLLNAISKESTRYRLCGAALYDSNDGATPSVRSMVPSCIEADRLDDVLRLNVDLIRLLQARAHQHYCGDSTQPAAVSAIEFVRHLHKAGTTMDVRKILQNLLRLEYLIDGNPEWQIGVSSGSEQTTRAATDESTAVYPNQEVKFVLLKPKLPLGCILRNKLHRFFLIIGTAAVVAVVTLLTYAIYNYVRSWRSARLAAVDNYVKAIECELMQRAAEAATGNEERAIIVNHLRDKLVPLSKRRALLWSWNEALRLLELNDSRIQFGVCMRNGEEFRTMQWIGGGGGLSTSSSSTGSGSNTPIDAASASPGGGDPRMRTKQWQSPAFDNVNRIVKPPTQCLKIRHMFDVSEVHNPQLKKIIKDAILYKVGARCNITDIQIDKQSCCVYVLCASDQDAGIVHNEINGWWFDKRLVSIKFLRLERYLSRFPHRSTANGGVDCSPSSYGQ